MLGFKNFELSLTEVINCFTSDICHYITIKTQLILNSLYSGVFTYLIIPVYILSGLRTDFSFLNISKYLTENILIKDFKC